jgi:hypothetical protein
MCCMLCVVVYVFFFFLSQPLYLSRHSPKSKKVRSRKLISQARSRQRPRTNREERGRDGSLASAQETEAIGRNEGSASAAAGW